MLWRTAILATLFAACAGAQITGTGTAPTYTAQSIVNGATQAAVALAPNAIGTIYGANLAFSTRTADASDLKGGSMPTTLDGVAVWINAIPCSLFYVSPGQINFLVPYELTAGMVSLIVARQGVAGPTVKIQLNSASPGLFLWNGSVVAEHVDGSVVSTDAPAAAGEIVVVFASGLGRSSPDTTSGRLPAAAAPLYYASQLKVFLNGTSVPAGNILYAGLAPGFAGLYQINLKIPSDTDKNPEIRVAMGDFVSPEAVTLTLR